MHKTCINYAYIADCGTATKERKAKKIMMKKGVQKKEVIDRYILSYFHIRTHREDGDKEMTQIYHNSICNGHCHFIVCA